MTARREGRVFALTLTGGFLFVALIAFWRNVDGVAVVAGSIAAISLLAAALIPGRLGPAKRAWMKLGEAIGRVTTPVILAIVYYGVVTPTALIRRVARRGDRSTTASAWHRRPPLPPPERMERQF